MSSREINIKLLTWGSIQLSAAELLIVVRHRHMLLLYTFSLIAMYKLRFHLDEPGMPVWLNVLIYATGHLLPLPLTIGTFLYLARLSKGTEPLQVLATPVIFTSVFLSALTIELISGLLGGNSNLSIVQLLAWSALQTCYGEVLGALVATFMLPRILAQIRSQADLPQEAVVIPPGKDDEGEAHSPSRLTLTVGGQRFPAEDLLHVRAEGNYVDLTFTTGRLYTLATLTSVTEQLAELDGCMLSRSVWVSAKATAGYRRDGANYVVALTDDREFRVARSRADRVLPWLKRRFSMSENA